MKVNEIIEIVYITIDDIMEVYSIGYKKFRNQMNKVIKEVEIQKKSIDRILDDVTSKEYLINDMYNSLQIMDYDINEKNKSINERLHEIEKLIQSHSVGVTNVYNEFLKLKSIK